MKSYLKFLSRNKLYTAIEFIGLSVALAFVIISFCYVVQQYAVTRENPDRERIYAVGTADLINCYGMKEIIDGKLPEVECVSHFKFQPEQLIHVGEQNFVGTVLVGDAEFFEFFPVRFSEGSPEMLSERNTVFISENLAKKLNDDPVGQRLIVQEDTLNIMGIIADKGSSLLPDFDVMYSFEYGQSHFAKSYRDDPFHNFADIGTFIKVRPDVDRSALAEKLKGLYAAERNSILLKEQEPSLVRFDELFFRSGYTGLNKGDRSMLRTMIVIGLLLLISALLNYINLNVALVGKRAKEMASRRLLGAQKSDIIGKYLAESFVFTLGCFLLGLLIAEAITPLVNRLMRADVLISIPFSWHYLLAYLVIVIVVSLLAGIIPAAIIAKTQPIDVVRGTFRFQNRMVLSKVFIVVQNIIAIVLISIVLTMELQMHHMEDRSMGLNLENLYFLDSDLDYTEEKEALVEDLRALPCVKELASADNIPGVMRMQLGLKKLHETEPKTYVPTLSCDTAAFRMLGFEVKERFGDADAHTFWITETTAAGMTGLPYGDYNIDTIMMWQKRTIGNAVCGVIADFKMRDALHVTDEEYVLVYGNYGWRSEASVLMEIVGDHREAKRAIDAVYKKHCEKVFGTYMKPGYNDFVEDVINANYGKTRRQMRLIEIIMAVAVLLALLGLVAMSTHFATEREKSIAIRKVFGGTMESETRRNLREYIIMMLIANVIAIPIAVWLCGRYLEGFAYRIPTYWWIFAIAAVLSFVIAIGSVLWQIISVAKVNPVSALKKE